MLTYDDLAAQVGALTPQARAELAKGPSAHGCNVCRVLGPPGPFHPPGMIDYTDEPGVKAALALYRWHDGRDAATDVAWAPVEALARERGIGPDEFNAATREWRSIMGYARCCLIYALAALDAGVQCSARQADEAAQFARRAMQLRLSLDQALGLLDVARISSPAGAWIKIDQARALLREGRQPAPAEEEVASGGDRA